LLQSIAAPYPACMQRLETDGKFFRKGNRRVELRMVTYGPFPGGWPISFEKDFTQIAAAGFNGLRLYQMPSSGLLDAAAAHGLHVFAGLAWASSVDFIADPRSLSTARVTLAEGLRGISEHPALAGVYVGNEVPSDLVRWMGPDRVRQTLEDLIALGRELAPGLLFAYGNYPSTEYLEPLNADFTAFNVYLEDEDQFRHYLRRLHHVAGDRPLVISEFGLDSRRNGLEQQARLLTQTIRIGFEEDAAGFTVYAWSDRWWNAGAEVLDWDFGLIDREGAAKPALGALTNALTESATTPTKEKFSVIVCTRNGRDRIGGCLRAIATMSDVAFETIVVDDGSTDGTADLVAERFPSVKLVRLAPSGLSAARNAGAGAANGTILAFTDDDCEPDIEWLGRLRRCYATGRFAAVGGPNLPPVARSVTEAIVSAAPGAPTHVMLDDEEAEHLPGCNLTVTKEAFETIGGFDIQFRTAGDDVDFCWRLRDAGYHLGFAPGAFVWHWRRPSFSGYLRQQQGYGRAEKLLLAKHRNRFTEQGEAIWQGFVYNGAPRRVGSDSIIYHGTMGMAGYQSILDRTMPQRGIEPAFDSTRARVALGVLTWLQPRLRAHERTGRWNSFSNPSSEPISNSPAHEFSIWSGKGKTRGDYLAELLAAGWTPGGDTDHWDVEKNGTRLLLATELTDGPPKRTLVRVWGDLVPDLKP
jgi:GT2 family glycosyltransferase